MRTITWTRIALGTMTALAVMTSALLGCGDSEKAEKGNPVASTSVTLQLQGQDPKTTFAKHYAPLDAAVAAKAPRYDLPLNLDTICNLRSFPTWRLTPQVRELLCRNGFAVVDAGDQEDIVDAYEDITDHDVPVFVTADTLLHLYHLQFDQTLKGIEEREFSPRIIAFTRDMLARSQSQQRLFEGDLKEAARRNVAYFAVALGCLDPTARPPAEVGQETRAELNLIEEHAGFSTSPIFKYREDYSQYVPRGHYTRSDTLKRYFKALMWYGRMSMLLKGKSGGGLVEDHDAKLQTLQACLIAGLIYGKDGSKLLDTWQRIYSVTAFYVGLADDLTPYEYAQAIQKVAGTAYEWATLANDDTLHKLKSELATYRAPLIYGGTGQVTLMPPFSPEQLSKLLDDTKGLRLMGQRFVADAYVMQSLIFPKPGPFTGTGEPFTLGQTMGGPQRVFARGLDVMAALGSERAYEILKAEGDTAYAEYDTRLAEVRQELNRQTPQEWNRNLYGGWLYALQGLLHDTNGDYPTLMTTTAYQDRVLWAALASWAQLKHDTILYAKQPYAPVAGAAAPGEELPPPPGYVEPLPEFYGRMLALARMTRAGLEEMKVLDETATGRLVALEEVISNLLRISKEELLGKPLSEQDVEYIKWIANRLEHCIEGIEENEDKTTIVADVLTDSNSGRCLEEGVGYVKLMIAAYKLPDGRIALGMGPVMSYYEFKHPVADRLTDEAWRQMLGSAAPAAPGWTKSFYVTG